MPRETMTPRERWLAVLNRQTPDRIPMDYWSTPEFSAKLIRHLGLSRLSQNRLVKLLNRPGRDPRQPNEARRALQEAMRCLHVDFVVHTGPRYIGPRITPGSDMYGCTYRSIDYGIGHYTECVTHPAGAVPIGRGDRSTTTAGPARIGSTTRSCPSRSKAGRITPSAAAALSLS